MKLTRRHFLAESSLGCALALFPKEAWALQPLEPIRVDTRAAARAKK